HVERKLGEIARFYTRGLMITIKRPVKTILAVNQQKITLVFRIMQLTIIILPMLRLRHASQCTNSTQQEYRYKSLHHNYSKDVNIFPFISTFFKFTFFR